MPNLVNMKLSESKKDRVGSSVISEVGREEFPFGLRLSLDDEMIKKLALGTLEVGDTMSLFAEVKVTEVSEREDEEGKRRHVDLQITDMSLHDGKVDDVAETFYGSS